VDELQGIFALTADRPDIAPFAGQQQKVIELLLPFAVVTPPAPRPAPPPPAEVAEVAEVAPPEPPPEPPAEVNSEPEFVLTLDESTLNLPPEESESPPEPSEPPERAERAVVPRRAAEPAEPVRSAPELCTVPVQAPLRWLIYQLQAAVMLL